MCSSVLLFESDRLVKRLLDGCSVWVHAAAFELMQELLAGGSFPPGMLAVCNAVLEV